MDPALQPAAAPPRPRSTMLPNGEPFYCCRPFDVPAYYRDIFIGAEYFKHGIALKPDAVVFDVGANIGMFAYYVGKNYPGATVYSFEPIPETFSALYWNAKRLGLARVTPFNLGLSNAARSVQFTYFPYSAGWSTMYPNWDKPFLESVENSLIAEQNMPMFLRALMKVPGLNRLIASVMRRVQLQAKVVDAKLETLSEMIRRTGTRQIDLLKIDVERAEWDVLEGIATEDWPKIKQMVIEVQIDHDPTNAERIVQRLRHHGFQTLEEKSDYLIGEQGVRFNSTIFATRPG
jgi:FkbM family methyltransferase